MIKLCFFLMIGLSLCKGQCPQNEIFSDCEDSCNTCDDNQPCPLICIPGCQCLPGYSRDSSFNCIPRQFCAGGYEQIQRTDPEVSRLLAWEDNRRGCPNEMLCKNNCQQQGSNLDGICTGPNKKYCQCYTCNAPSPISAPAPTSGSSGGCPNPIKCFRSCKKVGFMNGECIGPRKLKCRCKNETRQASDSLLSPNTVRGGCPVLSLCLAFCQGRGFSKGICLGPKSELCNCFSSASPPSPLPGLGGGSPLNPLLGGGLPSNPAPGLLSPNTVRGGCPVLPLCLSFCKGRGFSDGICLGPKKEYCNCFSSVSPTNPALPPIPGVSPRYGYGKPPPPPVPPVAPLPPVPPFQPPSVGCPNIASCVINCQAQGNAAGFCVGEGRRTCQCS